MQVFKVKPYIDIKLNPKLEKMSAKMVTKPPQGYFAVLWFVHLKKKMPATNFEDKQNAIHRSQANEILIEINAYYKNLSSLISIPYNSQFQEIDT